MSSAKSRVEQFAELVERCTPEELGALRNALLTLNALADAGTKTDDAVVRQVLEESGFAELCRRRRAAA